MLLGIVPNGDIGTVIHDIHYDNKTNMQTFLMHFQACIASQFHLISLTFCLPLSFFKTSTANHDAYREKER